MKCTFSERDLALYVEGDIAEACLLNIQKHLSACGRCKTLAEELRKSQAVLKSLRQEHVSAAALSQVQTRVVAEIAARAKPVWGRWVYAIIGFAVAGAVAIGAWTRVQKPNTVGSVPRVAAAPFPAIHPPERSAASEPSAVRPLKVKKRRHAPPRVETPAQTDVTSPPAKQLVVQLMTDDPNVVIYWLIDEKTGGSL